MSIPKDKRPFMCEGTTQMLSNEEIEFQKTNTTGEYTDFFFSPGEQMIRLDLARRVNGKIVKSERIYARIK